MGDWDHFWPASNYVVQDASQFRTAWVGREIAGKPFGDPPVLDFAKEMLLGISKGGDIPCFELRVTRVLEVGGELTVESQLRSTLQAGQACVFDYLPLFDFVWVPQSKLPVRFLPTAIISGK